MSVLNWTLPVSDQPHRLTPEMPAEMGQDPSLREIFRRHLLGLVQDRFGARSSPALVAEAIERARPAPEVQGRLRQMLFALSQRALIRTLNVSRSRRYAREPNTKCNVYARDFLSAMGAYLPTLWWTPSALDRLRTTPARIITREDYNNRSAAAQRQARLGRGEGSEIAPILDGNAGPLYMLNANGLHGWLREYGESFGWRCLGDEPRRAQEFANEGHIVILSAHGVGTLVRDGRSRPYPGHVTVVIAEDPGSSTESLAGSETAESAAPHPYLPLQSQAGSLRLPLFRQARGRWWGNSRHTDGNFWIFTGEPGPRVATPEEIGLRTGNTR
ncbi:MAG: hypothetical protein H6741_19730 [Alphaproteobacteria bacterium]|nr:hypothetical protein [Alphaproteobacteria bacterium]